MNFDFEYIKLQVKKRQQRVLMILDSKNVQYEVIDITEPGKEADKEFMQANSQTRESKYPLPPQIFNGEEYCGVRKHFVFSQPFSSQIVYTIKKHFFA